MYGGLPLTLHTYIDAPLRHQVEFQPKPELHQPEPVHNYSHPKSRLNTPLSTAVGNITSSEDWFMVGRRWKAGMKRSMGEREMLKEVRMDLEFLRVELEAFTTACKILRCPRGKQSYIVIGKALNIKKLIFLLFE